MRVAPPRNRPLATSATLGTSPTILALVAACTALATVITLRSWSGTVDSRFWFWCAACLAGELLWVRMPIGRVTVSMASCFQFAALILLPQGQAMAIAALTGLVAEIGFLRKPPVRALFNAAQSSLAVGAAAWVLQAMSGGSPSVSDLVLGANVLPLIVAGAAYFVINTGMVSLAVSLNDRLPLRSAWWNNFGGRYELLSNGALFSLGALIASQYAASGPGGTLLVILPVLVAFEGYRHVVRTRGGSTQATGSSASPDDEEGDARPLEAARRTG